MQCKTGRLRKGAVEFAACSHTYHHNATRRGERTGLNDYRGQADVFGVYCPGTAAVYMVPVEVVGLRQAVLRVDPPRNNQAQRIRWAADYELRPPG